MPSDAVLVEPGAPGADHDLGQHEWLAVLPAADREQGRPALAGRDHPIRHDGRQRPHDGVEHAIAHDAPRRAGRGMLRVQDRAARRDRPARAACSLRSSGSRRRSCSGWRNRSTSCTMAIGQFTAAATCGEVPVKSTVMSSPATLTSTAMRSGCGSSPMPSMQVLEAVGPVRDVGDDAAHQPLGLVLQRLEVAAQRRRAVARQELAIAALARRAGRELRAARRRSAAPATVCSWRGS